MTNDFSRIAMGGAVQHPDISRKATRRRRHRLVFFGLAATAAYLIGALFAIIWPFLH